MSAAMATIRRPTAFLTRSIILSNPQHRAGKPVRTDIARAYRCFTDLSSSIRRSLDPYKIAHSSSSSSYHSSARASATPSASSTPHISLHIAASSCGKQRKFSADESTHDFLPSSNDALGMQKGSSLFEKRRTRPQSGQDAYFVARIGNTNSTAFAIADGVGGWSDRGIDPADFSHALVSYMAQYALRWSDTDAPPAPKHLLNLGYDALLNDPEIEAGGSTACVGIVDSSGRMRVANLGDSGFVQLRLGRVHHYSDPQTHAFNTPYQMSLTPPKILQQSEIFGGVPINDSPDAADTADHMLRHGDVLVLATDGVWDNLDVQDVLKIVTKIMRTSGAWEFSQDMGYVVGDGTIGQVVQQQQQKTKSSSSSSSSSSTGTLQAMIAAAIVGEAKSAGLSKVRDSPFAKAVRKEYPGENWAGGKADDIAVLVAVSVDLSQSVQHQAAAGGVRAKL